MLSLNKYENRSQSSQRIVHLMLLPPLQVDVCTWPKVPFFGARVVGYYKFLSAIILLSNGQHALGVNDDGLAHDPLPGSLQCTMHVCITACVSFYYRKLLFATALDRLRT